MAPLHPMVRRERAWEHDSPRDSLARLPECEVIVDRRVAERRRGQADCPFSEWRRGDRQSGHLETPGTLVLFIH